MTKNSASSGAKVLYFPQVSTGAVKFGRRQTDSFGGNGGGGMELRLSKIETDIAVIKNSLSWIKGLGGGVFALVLLLIGLSVGGYFGLAGKVEDNAKSLVKIESSMGHITKQLDGIAKVSKKN
jgi:hypothetical protein